MMTLVALIVALFVDQALSARGEVPGRQWPSSWVAWCTRRVPVGSGLLSAALSWSLMVLVPAIAASLMYGLLTHLWSVLAWLWLVAVLVVALGFGHFAKRLADLSEAVELGDAQAALPALAEWARAGVAAGGDWRAQALASAVVMGHRRVLAVVVATLIGWLFGSAVFAVVLLVMAHAALSAGANADDGATVVAPRDLAPCAWGWLDGLAVRASVLAFALSGPFERVVLAWRDHSDGARATQDRLLLSAAGAAMGLNSEVLVVGVGAEALFSGEGKADADGVTRVDFSHFSALDSLVWRSLSVWLAVFGVLAIVRW